MLADFCPGTDARQPAEQHDRRRHMAEWRPQKARPNPNHRKAQRHELANPPGTRRRGNDDRPTTDPFGSGQANEVELFAQSGAAG